MLAHACLASGRDTSSWRRIIRVVRRVRQERQEHPARLVIVSRGEQADAVFSAGGKHRDG